MVVDGVRRQRRLKIRLTVWGWVLSVPLIVLIVLAIVAPSGGVYAGLAAVIFLWAWLLGSSFPSSQARGMFRRNAGETDFGREAADEYEHKYGHRF